MSTLKNKKVRFGYNGGDGRDWRQVLCVELKTRGGCGGGGGALPRGGMVDGVVRVRLTRGHHLPVIGGGGGGRQQRRRQQLRSVLWLLSSALFPILLVEPYVRNHTKGKIEIFPSSQRISPE